jgi:phosphoserine phosphatase
MTYLEMFVTLIVVLALIYLVYLNTTASGIQDIPTLILSKVTPGSVVISDFDNTLLDGDITFGKKDVFPGMMQYLYNNNITALFPGGRLPSGTELDIMYEKFPEYNLVYNIALFAGHSIDNIKYYARQAYQIIYRNYLKPHLLDLYKEIERRGGSIVILTGSPTLYLTGLQDEYKSWRVIGVETLNANNLISMEPFQAPFGKEKLRIVNDMFKRGDNIVAGFGNNDANDLPWLQEIKRHCATSVLVKGDTLTLL